MGDGIRLRHRRPDGEVVHVWNKHEQIVQYGYKQVDAGKGSLTVYEDDTLFYANYSTYGNQVTFDPKTGLFNLNGGETSYTFEQIKSYADSEYGGTLRNADYARAKNSHLVDTIYYNPSGGGGHTTDGTDDPDNPYFSFGNNSIKKSEIDTGNVIGRTKGNYIEQVKSEDGNAFPQNGHQNGYWYVYSHSYQK